MIGSVVGAHPYPYLVREFQRVIGTEARAQTLERYGRLPGNVVACVGGGSNALGIFAAFFDDAHVRLWGIEAAGDGVETSRTAAALGAAASASSMARGSYLLQSADGQVSRRTRSPPASTIPASGRNTRT